MSIIENNTRYSNSFSLSERQWLMFDDLLCDIVSRKDGLMQKLSSVYTNLIKVGVIILSQMPFKLWDWKINVISENLHLFLFKSPKNISKSIHSAEKISPYDNIFIVQSYNNI